MRRRIMGMTVASVLLGGVVGTASALADGGRSIAAATPITVGQQEFGNTANGSAGAGCFSTTMPPYSSWWAVNVTAGDVVTVNWATQSTDMEMKIYPEGTTDFTVGNVESVLDQNVNSNFADSGSYTAPQDGSLPIEFYTGCEVAAAPYNFTVVVQHAVVLGLPQIATLPLTGSETVTVKNADGVPISDPSLTVSLEIEGQADGSYTAIGSAPVANGAAVVNFTVPSSYAGEPVTLAAVSSGTNYVGGSSNTQSVAVAPIPCVVPSLSGPTAQASAEADIKAANCTVGAITHTHSTTIVAGDVVSLSPAPSTQLKQNAAVGVTVSSGPPPCIVPEPKATLAATEKALSKANCLAGKVVHVHSARIAKGRVVSLSHTPGSHLVYHTLIGIKVSSGPVHHVSKTSMRPAIRAIWKIWTRLDASTPVVPG